MDAALGQRETEARAKSFYDGVLKCSLGAFASPSTSLSYRPLVGLCLASFSSSDTVLQFCKHIQREREREIER